MQTAQTSLALHAYLKKPLCSPRAGTRASSARLTDIPRANICVGTSHAPPPLLTTPNTLPPSLLPSPLRVWPEAANRRARSKSDPLPACVCGVKLAPDVEKRALGPVRATGPER